MRRRLLPPSRLSLLPVLPRRLPFLRSSTWASRPRSTPTRPRAWLPQPPTASTKECAACTYSCPPQAEQ